MILTSDPAPLTLGGMRRAAIAGLLTLATALSAQDGLSPLTQGNIELGADYDGRKSFCDVLVKATDHAKDYRVTGCGERSQNRSPGRDACGPACDFLRRRAGTILYVDEKITVHKGTQPISTTDLQTKLERLGVTSVAGLLQSFGFTTIAVENGPTRELHYNGCM